MAIASATVAAITAAAAVAGTAGAIVGAVGLGLTLIGAVTKNQSLMKIGKIAGIAGGAMALGAFAAAGAASAFSATGTLAGEAASATTQTTASTIAESSIDEAAGALVKAGPIEQAMQAGAAAQGTNAAMGGADLAADAATGAGNLSTPQPTMYAEQMSMEPGFDLNNPNATPVLSSHDQSILAQAQLRAGERGPIGTAPRVPAIYDPGATGQPMQPQVSAVSTPGIVNQQTSMPTPTTVAPVAPTGVSQYGTPAGPQEASWMQKLTQAFQGAPDKPGFLSKLSPGEKAFLLSGVVQGAGGFVGGIYGGMNAAEQSKLQRWAQKERFNRGSYAPAVTFRGQGGGLIDAR